jgi:hypothetical protein
MNSCGLASSLPADFNEFAKYLEKERKRNWKQILCSDVKTAASP